MRFVNHLMEITGMLLMCFGLWFTVLGISQMPGCEGFGQDTSNVAQDAYDEAMLLIEAAAATTAELEKKENLSPEESAELARAKAKIALLKAQLESAADAEGNVTMDSGLMALTNFIPPPYNVPTGIIVGMLGTWMKGRKTRKSFKGLVQAINSVKAKNTMFAESLTAVGPALKAAMGESTARVVDAARKENKFPVA